ncbi:MAG TPA: hypothetical protein EYM79_02970 [Planctomycetes bacterium]|nr:hypothetical protein [Planctomycetota bacterium]
MLCFYQNQNSVWYELLKRHDNVENMLRTAALGMFLYGGYCVVDGLIDFVFAEKLEWWANLWGLFSGILLAFGAIFTRISFPGGLALAISGLLGLQAISLHNEIHLYGQLSQTQQLSRIALAALLLTLGHYGWNPDETGHKTLPGQDSEMDTSLSNDD